MKIAVSTFYSCENGINRLLNLLRASGYVIDVRGNSFTLIRGFKAESFDSLDIAIHAACYEMELRTFTRMLDKE